MRHFIFLTQEGYTFQPNSESAIPDIENLQVLGTASGTDEQNAFDNFIKESEYLLDTDYKEVVAMELKDERQYYFKIK
ncbi:hypothetical protein A2531_06545 [Candidatus Falkowbacteria bacterium RIFOXYD2_FULL_34_120]|uniref:Uncharacterized protein n=1 Tax=Candidatus Falkowbacteria bacterium RIFOXYD2_FULL_34_120 TaxID=1798007 RepID=A0A1F5TML4_9BACT|nr:MAG: hypothetical protein A2500_05055 [Candidatus Falkowbacteria bacterium RIFOXYC12_FULL_34_55]OGF38017.1 MAG: hypothetical protein A2466_03765 [Candidatus Falkowbacteria bacterium RIFOXYC2_FULL_34_220]OGF38272.1 MAG: hypothetical protein A2515_00675 [Candidatus Falkowbacteria bacterium RIFOXYD12_FULL_34_57]OGF40180.1 MAG: hypothetical protein A2531_06545 [Candidatus Falkowbacteria bacterium RIFOXYD2_FULL_34_120]